MKHRIVIAVLAAILVCASEASAGQESCPRTAAHVPDRRAAAAAAQEVVYQVFVRSMRDSNGDGKGDLLGLIDSLDYMQSLGVTSLLLTPLYPSHFYHNYFAYRFDGVDPDFGSMADFRRLVAALHARGMKIYLDQEVQYTESTHPWVTTPPGLLDEPTSDDILWDDSAHTRLSSGPFGLRTVRSFGNPPLTLDTVNLKSPVVQGYFHDFFLSWLDLDRRDDFTHGVDGFRIDHMMDDLDGKGVLTHLFAHFWRPLFARLREADPQVRLIAEQADWGYGRDFLTRGGADQVFAFPLHAAIRSFDRDQIAAAIRATAAATPPGKGQLLFVENHDVDRIASDPGITPEKLRTAAALNLLLAGTPLIYYGQELGMRGREWHQFQTDELGIGVREAFRWRADDQAPMEANWYRGGEIYWTQRYNRGHDGVSVQEEDGDPVSLLNFYRRLLRLRHAHPALHAGSQRILASASPLLVIERAAGHEKLWLVANMGSRPAHFALPPAAAAGATDLLGRAMVSGGAIALAPYQSALVATP